MDGNEIEAALMSLGSCLLCKMRKMTGEDFEFFPAVGIHDFLLFVYFGRLILTNNMVR